MNCKNCNAVIPDDSNFCTKCGTKVIIEETAENAAVAPETQVQEASAPAPKAIPVPDVLKSSAEQTKEALINIKKGDKKNIFDIVGIIGGAVLFIAGLICLFTSSPAIDAASFGADFYTYTYDGIYAVARLLGVLVKAVSIIMIVGGALIGCHFLGKIKSAK